MITVFLFAISLTALLAFAHTIFMGVPFIRHALHSRAHPTSSRPPLLRYFWAFLREWFYIAHIMFTYRRGPFARPKAGSDPAGGPPIVLCPGYLMNGSSMRALHRGLMRNGFRNVHTIDVRPRLEPIPVLAEEVQAQLTRIASDSGAPVVAIGHSQGGLLLRWLASTTGAPIARLITLGSPHHGTRAAVLARGPNALDMLPGSELLGRLPTKAPVPVLSIYSDVDQIIDPADSAAYGDEIHRVEGIGHFTLLYDRRVIQRVVEHLRPRGGQSSDTQ